MYIEHVLHTHTNTPIRGVITWGWRCGKGGVSLANRKRCAVFICRQWRTTSGKVSMPMHLSVVDDEYPPKGEEE